MKFHINKIVLWLKNGTQRELKFEANKVNVITGDSNTGKTAIYGIFDYCFFASTPDISQSIINENVLWYGIQFSINDKEYTIARAAHIGGKASSDYYFSSIGKIPEIVEANNSESTIKAIIETEFSIDGSITMPFGGRTIKAGSKISLRFFLLFNVISEDIILNKNVFFDKQNESRYREALERIFNIATGIESIVNVLNREEKDKLKKDLKRLEAKSLRLEQKSTEFNSEQEELIKQAKEYALIDSSLDFEDSIKQLEDVVSKVSAMATNTAELNEKDALEKELLFNERKIRNLIRFQSEYIEYKNNLKNIQDSLKPIEYLAENDSELLKTSIYSSVLDSFSQELKKIKSSRKSKTPVDNQVNDAITTLKRKNDQISEQLKILPDVVKNFNSEPEKLLFIGEIRSKTDLFSNNKGSISETTLTKTSELENEIDDIDVLDITESITLTAKLIEQLVASYMSVVSDALENYGDFLPIFNMQKKKLELMIPMTTHIESVGSSSNHMFLHLFLSLALQEVAFIKKSPFIAPFLIIDQPSRPYYGTENKTGDKLKHSDEAKITEAFKLLNSFIDERNKNNGEFQMIVFEHIPKRIIKEMENVHLVKEFFEGNALIPQSYLDEI
jgi:hypothetical protein